MHEIWMHCCIQFVVNLQVVKSDASAKYVIVHGDEMRQVRANKHTCRVTSTQRRYTQVRILQRTRHYHGYASSRHTQVIIIYKVLFNEVQWRQTNNTTEGSSFTPPFGVCLTNIHNNTMTVPAAAGKANRFRFRVLY